MSDKTISFSHTVNGALTDATSVVFSDPTGAFGLRRQDTLAVVVADGVALDRDGTGLYSKTVTGLVTGVTYEYWIEWVYSGATKRVERTFVAGVDQAEGHYAKRDKMIRKIGEKNLIPFTNFDAASAIAIDEDVLQAVMDEADRWADEVFRELEIATDLGATSPHLMATTNERFERVSDIVSTWAITEAYSARGLTGDVTNGAEGNFTDKREKAESALNALAAKWLDAQTPDEPDGGFSSVDLNVPDASCTGDEFSSW